MSDEHAEQIIHGLSWALADTRKLQKKACEAITAGREFSPMPSAGDAMRRAARRLERVDEDPEIFETLERHEHEAVLERWFGSDEDDLQGLARREMGGRPEEDQ